MFDTLDERGLLAEMSAAQRAERVALARRLMAADRLCQRRMAAVAEVDRTQWCIDNWEAVAAEVGAELGISRNRASTQMNYGVELLERLPRLAAVFVAGEVDFRVVAAAVFRTGLITAPDVLARIDAVLARRAAGWNRLSQKRLAGVLDMWVAEIDPAALRTARGAEADRHVDFGPARDGMVEFWGAIRAADAAVLERRLDQMAAQAVPGGRAHQKPASRRCLGRAGRRRGAQDTGRGGGACPRRGRHPGRAQRHPRLSARARTAGPNGNIRTEPSYGPHRRDAHTPPRPAEHCSFRSWPSGRAS